MPLTPPSTDDFERQGRLTLVGDEEDWAVDALQAATDVMELLTSLHTDPTDPLELRVLRRGITELAYAIFIEDEDREARYSPFTSERIGSYSYSLKSGSDLRNASELYPSGIDDFDLAVAYFLGQQEDGSPFLVSSERVFERKDDYPEIKTKQDYIEDGEIDLHDFFGR